MTGNSDTLIVDVVARLDERSFRQIQQDAERAGLRSGAGFGGGLVEGAEQGAQDAARAVQDGMQDAERAAEDGGQKAGGKLAGAFQGALAALPAMAAAAAVAVGAAAVAGVVAVTNMAAESAQNVNEFQAQLGATREEAERLGGIAEQVFGDNWTGSLTEAAAAVTTVRREVKGLAESELRSVTGAVVGIAETFGEEQGRVAAAVSSLMTATGMSAQEATDFIARGFQKGLNSSGDFLDTLTEYAPQFEKAKIGGGELFSLLETGAAKGALGTDKIADAFKEFGLTIVDVSEDSAGVYKELGLNQEKLVKGINDGSITQAQAFELVTNKLAEVKGQADRTRIGAAIFGGAGEDFANGLTQLDLTKTSMKDLAGGVDAVNTRYNSFRDVFQGVWRQVQVALLPVGKELLGIANEAMPAVKEALAQVTPVVTQVVRFLIDGFRQGRAAGQQFADQFGPQIERALVTFRPVLQAIGPLFASVFGLVKTLWETVLRPVLTAIAPLIAGTVATIGNTLNLVVRVVTGVVNAVSALLRGDLGGAVNALRGIFEDGVAFVVRQVRNMASTILGLIRNLAPQMAGAAADILRGLIRGIENGAGQVVQAARNMAGGIIDGIKKKLNIQSPSKEMYILGEHTAQGLANGIEKTSPAVQKAAAKVADTAISELARARAELEKQIKYDAWVKSLETMDASMLVVEATLARSAGQGDRYNAVLAAQARNAQELADATAAAAQATSDLVDAQIAAANSAAQRDPQGAADAAYRLSFGAGDVGLIRSLAAATGKSVADIRADVQGALDDAKRYAPAIAAIIERVYADALTHRREVAAEETRITARAVEMANDRRAQIVENLQAEQAAADDALITVDYLAGQLAELAAQGLDAKSNGFVEYLTDLSKGTGQAAAAAQVLLDNFDAFWTRAQFRAAQADAMSDTPAPALGVRPGTAAPEPAPARPAGPPNTAVDAAQNREALSAEAQAWKTRTEAQIEATRRQEEYRVTLKGLDIDQLKAAQTKALELGQMEKYAVLQEEILRLTKEQTDADKAAADAAAKRAALELNGTNVSGRFEKGRTEASDKLSGTVLNTVEAIGALANPATYLAFILEKLNIVGTIFEGILSVIAAPLAALQEPLRLLGELIGALMVPNLQLLAAVLTPVVRVLVAVYDALAALLKSITFGLVDITRDKYKQNSAALAPAAPSTTTPATASGNNVVQIPTSQVTVIASPDWVPKIEAAADKMLTAGEYMVRLAREGVLIRTEPSGNTGGGGAPPALLSILTP